MPDLIKFNETLIYKTHGFQRVIHHPYSFQWQVGVANGKIRDSPRRRDPCLKIRDLKVLTKSEPETLYEEINRAFCENPGQFRKQVKSSKMLRHDE